MTWRHILAVSVLTLSLLGLSAMLPVQQQASAQAFDVCKQAGASNSPVCHGNGSNAISGPTGILIKVANIFAFAGGVAAVFVILGGGFVYITASGDSGRANSGRNAVIYASIGLVVIVLGRTIIGFVITKFK